MTNIRALICILLLTVSVTSAAQILPTHPRLILDTTTLDTLQARQLANTPQWQQLKSYCDAYIGGIVNPPDANAYPNRPNIGQGYQGSDYWSALLAEGLCYQVLRTSNPSAAAPYGQKARDILVAMSTPYTGAGSHGQNPCTDSGYGIRFYGVGFGLGYDWAYDQLSTAQRQQIYTAANAWLSAFANKSGCAGFEYAHPQSNYFAGYFHAAAAIALGTYGENPNAPALWADWQNNQFNTGASNPPHIGVQPYYAAHLTGGGWPEGFGSYADLGILNMSLPAWEVKTAAGIDLVHATSPYTFPIDNADYLIHFTWPTRDYIDDRDTNHANGVVTPPPGTASTATFMHVLAELRYWNAPHADAFQQYTNEVNTATSGYGTSNVWESFLFWDPNGTKQPLTTLPLSYFANGMNAVAARSDWTTNASWMSFRAGPYVNNSGQGEEIFDQGSIALVRGKVPLLVNGTGWIVHEPNGTAAEDDLYNDNYGNANGSIYSSNRTIYNIFYVRRVNGNVVLDRYGQAAYSTEDYGVRTHIAGYEDGSSYVYTLATNLEDMYRRDPSGNAQVVSWAREIVYLRPNQFMVYDRTSKSNASNDQFLAFHFPANPANNPSSGSHRFDVTYGSTYAGAMTTILPTNAVSTTIGMYPDNFVPAVLNPDGSIKTPAYTDPGSNPVKVWQVQIRPPDTNVNQKWLTAFDLSSTSAAIATAGSITVTSGAATGALLASSSGNNAVIFNTGAAGTTIAGTIAYSVPALATSHVVTELPKHTTYSVTTALSGGNHLITVIPGGSLLTSAQGVLTFNVAANGSVTPDGGNPPPNPPTITSQPANPTTSTSATFAWTTTGTVSTTQCSLDSGAFAACTSPQTYTALAIGSHTFTVQVSNANGSNSAASTWTINALPAPTVSITSQPANPTTSTSASFAWTTTGTVSTTQCSLDFGVFAACTSPQTYTALAIGSHTFTVQVSNVAGPTNSATSTWTINAPAPTVSITSQPTNPTTSTSASFAWTTTGTVSTTQCSLDSGAFAACTSPQTYTALAIGSHTFTVQVSNATGSNNAASTWTIDALPAPTVSITSQPANPTTSTSASFAWTTTGTVSTTQCSLDSGAFAACTSPQTYTALAVGSHTFTVQVSNAAGSNSAASTWTIDALPAPTVSITSQPANPTTSTSASFAWTTTGTVSTTQCSLDSGAFAACTSPKAYTGLSIGSHIFRVQVANAGGSNSAASTWTINVPAPTVSITSQPANSTTSTSASFAWTTTGTVGTTQCNLDSGAFAACTSPQTYTALAIGSHTFTVQVSNATGSNSAASTWTITALSAPTVNITSQPANPTTSTSASFAWATTGTVSTTQCRLDSGTFTACTSPKTYTALAIGSHTFKVRVSNTAGTSTATSSWTISTSTSAPPTVTITPASTPSNPTSSTNASFAWTTTGTVSTTQCSLDSAPFATCTSPKAYTGLSISPHMFRVQVANAGGSNTATYAWTSIAPLFGTTNVTSQLDSNPMGMAEAFQINTSGSASGNLSKLQIFVDASSTTGTLVAGLYADTVDSLGNHKPGTLLTQGSLVAPTKNDWNTVTVPGIFVTPNTAYWIAVLGTQSGKLYFRDTGSGGCKCQTSFQTTLTALPVTWSTGTLYGDCPLSAYGMP